MFARTSAMPAVGASVRKPLRLLPLDLLVHVREDGVHVAAREGFVRAHGGRDTHRGSVLRRGRRRMAGCPCRPCCDSGWNE